MISLHIEANSPSEMRSILAGLVENYVSPQLALPFTTESIAPATRAKKDVVPSAPPLREGFPALPVQAAPAPPAATVIVDAGAHTPGTQTAATHTRDSIKAAIKTAGLPKAKIVELLTSAGAKNLAEVPDNKIQDLGNAVLAAVFPAPGTEAPTAPAAPAAAPEGPKGHTRESVMPMHVDAMAKDRPGLIKLLAEFGTTKLSTLDDSKIPAYGIALEKFLATPAAAAA